MKRLFSISRSQTPIIFTLMVVILLSTVYAFIYIPEKEKELQKQHFRWLQAIYDNIYKKIENCDTILTHFLDIYSKDTAHRKKVESYLNNNPSDKYTLFATSHKLSGGIIPKRGKSQIINIDTASVYPTDSSSYVGTLYSMNVYQPLRTFIISASILSPNNAKGSADHTKYSVSMQYTFESFLGDLFQNRVFDHYVVFSNNGVVYEDFPSGLSYINEDSLLLISKSVTGSKIIDQKVGGVDYKIFLQPVPFAKNKWIIAGLHNTQKYNAEKRQLPTGFVLLLLVIALGILLFIPLIRIYNLGRSDRLRIIDTVELVIVIKLLTSLLFFALFWSYLNINDDSANYSQILSSEIDSAFRQGVKTASSDLDLSDSIFKRDNTIFQKDLRNINGSKIDTGNYFENLKDSSVLTFKSTSDSIKIDSLRRIFKSKDISVSQVFWLDSSGNLLVNWNVSKYNVPHTNYKDRDYFKNSILKRTFWADYETKGFYLDQEVSRTTGDFKTYISKLSAFKNNKGDSTHGIVCLIFSIKALDTVIMPGGYTFAIINNDGRVIYHKDTRRNLFENLKEEFSNTDELNEALHGRFAKEFKTNYYDKEYETRVQPVVGFPYFIVLMEDLSYNSSRKIETASTTSGMVVFFFLFVLIDVGIVVLASSRRSYFKKQFIVKTWLWPRSSSQYEYRIGTIGNVLMILFILISFLIPGPYVENYFILLLSIPITSLFINIIFALKYIAEKSPYKRYKYNCIIGLILFIVLINITVSFILGKWPFRVILFELFCLLAYWLLIIKSRNVLRKYLATYKKSFINSYALMIFSRIIVTSGLPVIFFYISSYNYEQNLIARYKLNDFANDIIEKYPEIQSSSGSISSTVDSLNGFLKYSANSIFLDHHWIDSCFVKYPESVIKHDLTKEESFTASLFNQLGLDIKEVPVNNDNFYLPGSADSSFVFNNFFEDVLYKPNGRNELNVKLQSGNYLNVDSKQLTFFPVHFSLSFKSLLLKLVMLTILFLFYRFIVLKLITIVFAPRTFDIKMWNDFDYKIFRELGNSISVFIIAPPGPYKNEILNLLNAKIIDLTYIPDVNEKEEKFNQDKLKSESIFKKIFSLKHKSVDDKWNQMKKNAFRTSNENLVILENFDYKYSDIEITKLKLSLIEDLISKKKNFLIFSSVPPLSFVNSFPFSSAAKVQKSNARKHNELLTGDYIEKWNALIGGLPITVMPLQENSDDVLNDWVSREIQPLLPVKYLKNNIIDLSGKFDKNDFLKRDLFILKLQTAAANYYANLWDSLTNEEKFILYDLAEDGLVNTKDSFNFNLLVSKGFIISKDGLPHIFSISFRNFILTGISDYELDRIKEQINERSSWDKIKAPLILVMIAILIFVFSSQEGLFARLIIYITGLAGAIPVIVNLISLFNRGNGKVVKME